LSEIIIMKVSSNDEVFNKIYKYHKWGYGSGSGSIWMFNKPFVHFVNKFLREHPDIKVVVDIGSGDWQLGRHFELGDRKYIGCDVSDVIVNKVKRKYFSENKQFLVLDAVEDELPDGDLVIIKDVLQHLPNNEISRILSKISKYKYIIITNCILNKKFVNRDIRNGSWRPIDISIAPFNSKLTLVEKYTEGLRRPINFVQRVLSFPTLEKAIYVNRK